MIGDFVKKFFCSTLTQLIKAHIRKCDDCRNGLLSIRKELPILRPLVSQDEIETFLKGE